MPINPLIPLSGNQSRLPDIFSLATQRKDRLDQNRITNEQNERTLDMAETKQRAATALADREAETARQNEAMRSIAIYHEAELKPLLESGNTTGAIDSLTNRSSNLQSQGIDNQDTEEAIRLLKTGNVDEVLRLGGVITQTARMSELIPVA